MLQKCYPAFNSNTNSKTILNLMPAVSDTHNIKYSQIYSTSTGPVKANIHFQEQSLVQTTGLHEFQIKVRLIPYPELCFHSHNSKYLQNEMHHCQSPIQGRRLSAKQGLPASTFPSIST